VKVISPLLGFNNNVKHKGRVFHIQTEDSGVRHPHVITHLFADGGRILKTMKTSYAEHLNEANVQEVVRSLMKEQHKAMFIALRDGQFDHIFEDAPNPAAAAAPATPPPPADTPAAAAPAAAAPSPQANLPKGPIPSITMPKVDPAAIAAATASASGPTGADALTTTAELDLDKLAAAAQDVPPPPASLKKSGAVFTAGVYRALNVPEPSQPSPPTSGRYAPSRPPAFFATARPAQGASIFGEDLISEKSLDEVILSYLAEDLEGSEGV